GVKGGGGWEVLAGTMVGGGVEAAAEVEVTETSPLEVILAPVWTSTLALAIFTPIETGRLRKSSKMPSDEISPPAKLPTGLPHWSPYSPAALSCSFLVCRSMRLTSPASALTVTFLPSICAPSLTVTRASRTTPVRSLNSSPPRVKLMFWAETVTSPPSSLEFLPRVTCGELKAMLNSGLSGSGLNDDSVSAPAVLAVEPVETVTPSATSTPSEVVTVRAPPAVGRGRSTLT